MDACLFDRRKSQGLALDEKGLIAMVHDYGRDVA